MLMINNEAWVSVVFSGDASAIMTENENMVYSVPKEGTNLWFDNIVIPKTSKMKMQLINLLTLCLDQKMQHKMLNS